MASPTAMPIIRATVTIADATPNARRPAASTAAVERGVTVSPNPKPEDAERERRPSSIVDARGPARPSPTSAADAEREADERHQAERQDPDDEARDERPERRRAGQRPEREPLLVRAAVEHAIDEHGAADDRGGEARTRSAARRARPS